LDCALQRQVAAKQIECLAQQASSLDCAFGRRIKGLLIEGLGRV
jgi:hypothetical protein